MSTPALTPQPAQQKMSIKDFATTIRSGDEQSLADISDEDLVRSVFERRPDLMQHVETSVPRPGVSERRKQRDEDFNYRSNFVDGKGSPRRFAEGLSATFPELVQGVAALPGAALDSMKETGDVEGGLKQLFGKMVAGVVEKPGSLVDLPNVERDMRVGNEAGAAGRSITQGILTALTAGGAGKVGTTMANTAKAEKAVETAAKTANAVKTADVMGAGMKADKAMLDVAKTLTRPHAAVLDSAIEGIDAALSDKIMNVKDLRAGIDKATKSISKIEAAPSTQVRDVSAAKDVVERLAERTKKGMLPGNELRQFVKELKEAKKGLGTSVLKQNLQTIIDTADDQLKAASPAYETWLNDYKSVSRIERAYAKAFKGQTLDQQVTKMTAKNPASLPIPLTTKNIKLGPTKAQQITNTNKSVLDSLGTALTEVHKRVSIPGRYAERVGTAEAAANDTALFAQAKKELGPNASLSEVAQRAQALKTGAAKKK